MAQDQAAEAGAVERSEEAASRQLPAEASSQEAGTEGGDSRLISAATSTGKMKTWNSRRGSCVWGFYFKHKSLWKKKLTLVSEVLRLLDDRLPKKEEYLE